MGINRVGINKVNSNINQTVIKLRILIATNLIIKITNKVQLINQITKIINNSHNCNQLISHKIKRFQNSIKDIS